MIKRTNSLRNTFSTLFLAACAMVHSGCGPGPCSINSPPEPDAGPDQTTIVGEAVTLDGSATTDLNDDTLGFTWEQTAGPVDVELESAIAETTSFVPTVAGVYRFRLTASDGCDLFGGPTDTIQVEVMEAPCEPDCDDGVFCNGEETCEGGTCVAGDDPCPGMDCNESERSCIATSGLCARLNCDDGVFCNGEERCESGACIAGGQPCEPGETCNEAARRCETQACDTDRDCDDGNLCTIDECDAGRGECNHTSMPCAPDEPCDPDTGQCTPEAECGRDDDCDDDDPCTVDSCELLAGACAHLAKICPDNGSCDPETGECTNDDMCEVLSEHINSDRTLVAGCYIVSSGIWVRNDAMLTIEAGAELYFEAGTELQIQDDGTLRALGTASNPILMTGMQQVPGFWNGLLLRDTPGANRLEFVTIEYGGGDSLGLCCGDNRANVVLQETSIGGRQRTEIVNCTLQHSAGVGLYISGDANLAVFEGNTITSNLMGIANVRAENAGMLTEHNDYTGNDQDVVIVRPTDIDIDQAWHDLNGGSYLIADQNAAAVDVRARLTLGPSTILVFQSGTEMQVVETGTISAVGTADAPILLTGEEPAPGYWNGLLLRDTPGANRLEFVTIEYGGGESLGLCCTERRANVVVQDTSLGAGVRLDIRNSTLRDSQGFGIWLQPTTTSNAVDVNGDFATANAFAGNPLGDVGP